MQDYLDHAQEMQTIAQELNDHASKAAVPSNVPELETNKTSSPSLQADTTQLQHSLDLLRAKTANNAPPR
ncbi:MAG: hypothetical protein R2932_10780 [Caldilineaceae bacterium]